MKKHNVTVLVRTCKRAYIEDPILQAGIKIVVSIGFGHIYIYIYIHICVSRTWNFQMGECQTGI